jgi:AraC-like DNA-binding protein
MPAPSIRFEYHQTPYPNWIKEFAGQFGLSIDHNLLRFPAEHGEGYSRAVQLDEGLTAAIQHYRLNRDGIFIRKPTDRFGVLIYLYQFDVGEAGILYELNNQHRVEVDPGIYHTTRVVNAETSHELRFSASTWVRGISFFLEESWLKNHISGHLRDVFAYLQKVDYFKEFVQAKQQRLLQEILTVPADHPFLDMFLRSRLLRMLDKVLENMASRDTTELPEKLSETDFSMVQRVELQLIQNYTDAFPSIERLSRVALMSESKLKKLFKQSYGMGMYEYYQKNRMHKAREMILSRRYTITEVGTTLGYQNLSNFSAGFRKEFGCLPSELLTES